MNNNNNNNNNKKHHFNYLSLEKKTEPILTICWSKCEMPTLTSSEKFKNEAQIDEKILNNNMN